MRAILLTTLLTIPGLASATQVISLDLNEMTDRADVIVHGTVVAVTSERMPQARGRIHTKVIVEPTEVLRSDRQQVRYELSVPGGTVGRIGQLVPGAPKFTVGEEVLVLLARHEATQRLVVVGLSQGRYRVERAPGQAPTLVSDRHGAALMMRDTKGRLVEAPAERLEDRRPLSTTLDTIRERVRTQNR